VNRRPAQLDWPMLPSRRPCTPRVKVRLACTPRNVRLADPVSPLNEGIPGCKGLLLKSSHIGLPPRYSTVGLRRPKSASESSASDCPSCHSDDENAGNTPSRAGPAGVTPRTPSRAGPAGVTPRPKGYNAADELSDGHGVGSASASASPGSQMTPSSLMGSPPSWIGSPQIFMGANRQSSGTLYSPAPLLDKSNLLMSDTDTSISPQKRRGASWLDSESESPSKRVHIGVQSNASWRQKVSFFEASEDADTLGPLPCKTHGTAGAHISQPSLRIARVRSHGQASLTPPRRHIRREHTT
jgi:hypothetical protein